MKFMTNAKIVVATGLVGAGIGLFGGKDPNILKRTGAGFAIFSGLGVAGLILMKDLKRE